MSKSSVEAEQFRVNKLHVCLTLSLNRDWLMWGGKAPDGVNIWRRIEVRMFRHVFFFFLERGLGEKVARLCFLFGLPLPLHRLVYTCKQKEGRRTANSRRARERMFTASRLINDCAVSWDFTIPCSVLTCATHIVFLLNSMCFPFGKVCLDLTNVFVSCDVWLKTNLGMMDRGVKQFLENMKPKMKSVSCSSW